MAALRIVLANRSRFPAIMPSWGLTMVMTTEMVPARLIFSDEIQMGHGFSRQSSSRMTALRMNSSDMIRITDSAITTEAENAGGGRMTINVNNSLHLSDAEITSSVRYGAGNGGDIRIGLPEFFIMNHSRTIARAYEGEGGNIDIAAEHFIQSSDSVVDASSALGIDGIVRIESPDEDVGDALTVLPVSYIDAARWLGKPCRERGGEAVSHFVMQGKDAIPTAFDDWLPSPLPWIGDRSESDE